jgi:hypothetical protein
VKFLNQGITVIFLHHHRKGYGQNPINSQEMRGSSVIWGRIDSQLIVSKQGKTEGTFQIIQVDQTKMRNGEEGKPFELHMEELEEGMIIKYAGEKEHEDIDKGKLQSAIELIPDLLQGEGKTNNEIRSMLKEDLDIKGRTVFTAIQALVKNNVIKQGWKGKERFNELKEVSQDDETLASV